MSAESSIQSHYPKAVAQCFGCGAHNPAGHQLQSFGRGDHTVAHFTPKPEHMAIPGFVYGGLIASLIDCHGTGTGTWAALNAGEAGDPIPRFVTGKLEVSYEKPTPMGVELELIGRVREQSARKVVVDIELSAAGVVTAEGTVIAVRMPESWG
ncbi:PaaI family thioesterase [Pseudenhygromyxa sp. WMMC2535]|uniref:PaaI family thioesterase n=1 Tax=Pseudenhygromyxa sp. WMMC2535 TaxID=2712867 RepID=UPI001553033F|nr:PaaI family thioesterase [Pseudenhygromyxa sp. WMMC2535]NVB40482.1 PaaI family thioesterase [Pseudenhygromyxa sp. WMMC2535]